jgi:class 3 adenylate cyclase/CheY-like chemotaxis protein
MPVSLFDSRILILDDNQINCDLLESQLKFAGFTQIHTITDSLKALDTVAEYYPDIILMDVMMPNLNGYEVTEQLRIKYPDQLLPIILVSALNEPNARTQGISAGANDFLSKPVDVNEMTARVRSLLALKHAQDQIEAERKQLESLLNQIANPVIVTDPDGVIGRINLAAQEIFKVGEDRVGQTLNDVFGMTLDDLRWRAKERSSPVSGTYRYKNPETEELQEYQVSVSPIESEGFILFWQDISALRESERVHIESERAEKRQVIEAFSHYMSPALVERVLNDPDIMSRRERREGVVLFADLRGFTRLTTQHEPDRVMELLNHVFAALISIINEHEGLVFDIIGDELMIAFNVPYDQENMREKALTTALVMVSDFVGLQDFWANQGMKVGLGIGITSGPVVLGHIGGASQVSYTMVGETINVAHRLVEMAEDKEVVVTREMLFDDLVKEKNFTVREIPDTKLQGIPEPVSVYIVRLDEQNVPAS